MGGDGDRSWGREGETRGWLGELDWEDRWAVVGKGGKEVRGCVFRLVTEVKFNAETLTVCAES